MNKRKRSYRKRPTMTRSVGSSIFSVKQKTFYETWTFSSAATVGFWRYYLITPGVMTNYAQHAAVFDEYKITGITLEFRPSYDSHDASSTLAMFGQIHTIVDPSSSTLPTGVYSNATLNSFLEQGGVKTSKFGSVVTKYFKPKVPTFVQGAGIAGRLINAPWLRTDDVDVEHRGVHVYLQSTNTALTPIKYDVFVTHHIKFRGHR